MTKRGKFISLEGVEGVGKSTAMKFIQSYLREQGIDFVVTREPGGTPLAEDIRKVLLNQHDEPMCSDTELLLMFATRAQNVAQVIKPALEAGRWVLSDRFTDASFAYQGGGRGIAVTRIEVLADWVLGGLKPDMTLLLDAPVHIGLERIAKRKHKDRIEHEQEEFFRRVREAYLDLADRDPERFRIVHADHSIREVQAQITVALQSLVTAA